MDEAVRIDTDDHALEHFARARALDDGLGTGHALLKLAEASRFGRVRGAAEHGLSGGNHGFRALTSE